MNGPATLFVLLAAVALLTVPRRWAPLPLLAGACYMTLAQGIEIGSFSFPVLRLLVLVGFIRVLTRGEKPAGAMLLLDKLLLLWAAFALFSSMFHVPANEALIFRLGLVFNVLGVYFLMRCFCRGSDDVVHLTKLTAILLIPLAAEMFLEQVTGRNLFSILGGVGEAVIVREGRRRAQGPFAHSILAGTVGAACLPLMIGIWRRHRLASIAGGGACAMMVVASSSSGPLMSAFFAVGAVVLWRWRKFTQQMRIAAVIVYVLLDLVMSAPAYFLIARIDLTGGSTGWHRAELMRSSFEHLGEWWWAGTDYTRHWMRTGVSWSPDHTDITNYYLKMGVWGGLPLMFVFISAMSVGFVYVGRAVRKLLREGNDRAFICWTLGAGLFAHATTSISVSYFDQSFLFLYLNLAAIGSVYASGVAAPVSISRPRFVSAGIRTPRLVGVQSGRTARGQSVPSRTTPSAI